MAILSNFDGLFFKEQLLNVDSLDLEKLSQEMSAMYRSKDFEPKIVKKGNSYVVSVEKNMGGANFFFGKQQSLTAELSYNDGVLNVVYSNGAWFGKIIGIGFGVILCFVPTVMSILGTVKQVKLYNSSREFVENFVNKH